MASQVTTQRIILKPQCRSRAKCSSASSSSNGRPTNEIRSSPSTLALGGREPELSIACSCESFAGPFPFACTSTFEFTFECILVPGPILDLRNASPRMCEGTATGYFGNLQEPLRLTPLRRQALLSTSRRKVSRGTTRKRGLGLGSGKGSEAESIVAKVL